MHERFRDRRSPADVSGMTDQTVHPDSLVYERSRRIALEAAALVLAERGRLSPAVRLPSVPEAQNQRPIRLDLRRVPAAAAG